MVIVSLENRWEVLFTLYQGKQNICFSKLLNVVEQLYQTVSAFIIIEVAGIYNISILPTGFQLRKHSSIVFKCAVSHVVLCVCDT